MAWKSIAGKYTIA